MKFLIKGMEKCYSFHPNFHRIIAHTNQFYCCFFPPLVLMANSVLHKFDFDGLQFRQVVPQFLVAVLGHQLTKWEAHSAKFLIYFWSEKIEISNKKR
jgi:hypothetical protein